MNKFTTRRAYMGNTMISAHGAAAHGLSLNGTTHSFVAATDASKMIVVSSSAGSDSVEIVKIADARAKYAALVAKGATKCSPLRTAYGIDYNGFMCFDVDAIMMVPESDVYLQGALLPQPPAGTVIFG